MSTYDGVRIIDSDGALIAVGDLEIESQPGLSGDETIWTGKVKTSADVSLLLVPQDGEAPPNRYTLEFPDGRSMRIQIPAHDAQNGTLIIRGLEALS